MTAAGMAVRGIGSYFIFLAATVATRGPVLSGAARVPDDIIWGP